MTKELTENQTLHLALVTQRDIEWREAKRNAPERARRAAEHEIAMAFDERNLAVADAIEAGLPKIELRRKHQGLHTVHASAVQVALAAAQSVVQVAA